MNIIECLSRPEIGILRRIVYKLTIWINPIISSTEMHFSHSQMRYLHKTKKLLSTATNDSKDVISDRKEKFKDKLSLKNFMTRPIMKTESIPYLKKIDGDNKKVYLEIFGCQMNVNDGEIILAILKKNGYKFTKVVDEADIILILTCSIRSNAELKIIHKLKDYRYLLNKKKAMGISEHPKIGLLGCMAERLKFKLLERDRLVDIVAGPDSYKDLPRLLAIANDSETAINVILSADETYADITPVRLNPDSISAFVTIMRGCDNMCTYCIVPFTRGRERSRSINSIEDEIRNLSNENVKEIILLGQNVNSYLDSIVHSTSVNNTQLSKGFTTVYKSKQGGLRFYDLLDRVSLINPEIRIRFTSPHPKDFPDSVLQLIAERPNICKSLHLPAQSGNSDVLKRMRRGYTKESYLELIENVRNIIPNCYISSDFIVGFCGETDSEFEDTISLMELVKYNNAYLFPYSMREKTAAHRRYEDDVSPEVKKLRMIRITEVYRREVEKLNTAQIGQQQLILIEGSSKKNSDQLVGRNDGNIRVIIPNSHVEENKNSSTKRQIVPGDYVVVQIVNANSQTLRGDPLYISTLVDFEQQKK